MHWRRGAPAEFPKMSEGLQRFHRLGHCSRVLRDVTGLGSRTWGFRAPRLKGVGSSDTARLRASLVVCQVVHLPLYESMTLG